MDLRCAWSSHLEAWLKDRPSIRSLDISGLDSWPGNVPANILPRLEQISGPARRVRAFITQRRHLSKLTLRPPQNSVDVQRVLESCLALGVRLRYIKISTSGYEGALPVLAQMKSIEEVSFRVRTPSIANVSTFVHILPVRVYLIVYH